jgi:hypothetical protein
MEAPITPPPQIRTRIGSPAFPLNGPFGGAAILERFQEKCAALFRFENATNQKLEEHFPIPTSRKML